MTCGISLVGVGGQGTLLVARILSAGLVEMGFDVKVSEIHGMAQRGGSVVTQLRYGKQVFSPIMAEGESDVLVSFEKIEAARHLHLLKPGGILIINDILIPPVPLLAVLNADLADYAGELSAKLIQRVPQVRFVQAPRLAERLGNVKVQNVIILGVLIAALKLPEINWDGILKGIVPDHLHGINSQALNIGLHYSPGHS